MIKRAVIMLLTALLFFSCAKVRGPTGGPLDRTPAVMTGSEPDDGSTGVGSLNMIEIGFSERVNRGSVLEMFRTDPGNLIRHAEWRADTLLSLEFWNPFPTDTTIAVYLLPGWLDRHFVEQREWQIFHFATGDSLREGWFTGKVTFKGNPSRLIHLQLEDELGAISRRSRPDRQGGFVFRHLPADGRQWRLFAFQDMDKDSLYDPVYDFADSLCDSMMVLTPEISRRHELILNVIDPTEPGEISGSFACTDTMPGEYILTFRPDSLRLAGDLLPADNPALLPESLLTAFRVPGEITVFIEEPGRFRKDAVSPGPWWLLAFKDLEPDSLWDPQLEPAWLDPGPRTLDPGGTLVWPSFRFGLTDSLTGTIATTPVGGDSLPQNDPEP